MLILHSDQSEWRIQQGCGTFAYAMLFRTIWLLFSFSDILDDCFPFVTKQDNWSNQIPETNVHICWTAISSLGTRTHSIINKN